MRGQTRDGDGKRWKRGSYWNYWEMKLWERAYLWNLWHSVKKRSHCQTVSPQERAGGEIPSPLFSNPFASGSYWSNPTRPENQGALFKPSLAVTLFAGQERVQSKSREETNTIQHKLRTQGLIHSSLSQTQSYSTPHSHLFPYCITGSSPHGRVPRPRPRCGRISEAVEEVGRIRVSRKRKVTTRVEEEKFNTEADYFESSAPWQNDTCSQVGAASTLGNAS